MKRARSHSLLHMQMGQETIYLLLSVTLFSALVMASYLLAVSRAQTPHDPPIVVLPETEGYYFAAGSATLSPGFEERLRRLVVPKVQEIGSRYDAKVIEVIGHTDEIPLHGHGLTPSNLDAVLVPMFTEGTAGEPVAADNAGLGMARAVAVARFLRTSGLGNRFSIVPLSAGSFLRTDDRPTTGGKPVADEARRRIEIRVRQRETGQ